MNAITPLNSGGGEVGGKVRVFVVDDSSMVRAVYTRILGQDPGLELVGTAYSAEDALGRLGELHVHVVLLDLEMPGMGGMRALPEIIRKTNGAKVMVVSTLTQDGAEATVQALTSHPGIHSCVTRGQTAPQDEPAADSVVRSRLPRVPTRRRKPRIESRRVAIAEFNRPRAAPEPRGRSAAGGHPGAPATAPRHVRFEAAGDGRDEFAGHALDVWPTGRVFLPSHRMRVHVASSGIVRRSSIISSAFCA